MSAVRLRRSDLAAASILTVLLLVAAAPCPAAAPAPALSRNGMVVTSQPDATRAGVAMLEAGGNAVDAAVAAAFAVGVTQPFSAGLGGGGFILIHRPGGQVVAVDARETAPAAADRDMYVRDGVRDDASMVGGLAVATPGWVAGLALALESYGTLSLAAVVAPAVALAEQGYAIGPYHARMLERMRSYGLPQRFPETARIQFPPEGQRAEPGWRLVQKDLAATLRAIGRRGPPAFYSGRIARAMAAEVKGQGGLLTEADLAAYRPVVREPVRGSYRGFEIHSFPPPSSGGVALVETLNILEGFELGALGPGSSASYHRIAEALKLAFADRAAFLGDSDFVDVPVARLVAKPYAASLRARINPAWWRRPPWSWPRSEVAIEVRGPGLPVNDAGTTHLSIFPSRWSSGWVRALTCC